MPVFFYPCFSKPHRKLPEGTSLFLRIIILLSGFCLALPCVPAQEDYLLPFSLQSSIAEAGPFSDFAGIGTAPSHLYTEKNSILGFAGTFARIGFIKENGHYGLAAGLQHGKNLWRLHYRYQGYTLLNRQEAGLSYSRNFIPGLSAGLTAAYRTGNRIEDKKKESLLELALSSTFKTGIWAFGFEIRHPVVLYSLHREEWNRALSLRIGAACNLYKDLHAGLDLYKDLRYPFQAGLGFGYLFREIFLIYAQARINPSAYKLGFGYHGKSLRVELAVSYQHPLGFETCVGVIWKQPFTRSK